MRITTSERMRVGQLREDLGRLVGIEIGEHDRDDLRMLVADELGHGARVHPLERFEALARGPDVDAVDDARGLVFAERIHEHLAQELVRADADGGLLLDHGREVREHGAHFLARHIRRAAPSPCRALHFPRAHVLEDLRGFLLAERQQQDRGALGAAAALRLVRLTHRLRHPGLHDLRDALRDPGSTSVRACASCCS